MLGEKFVCEDCDEQRSIKSFAGSCNDKTCIRQNLCCDCCIVCEGCGLDFCTHHAHEVAEEGRDDKFLCQSCKDGGK
jgi:hypothetical protein